jgi:hypothetical protein
MIEINLILDKIKNFINEFDFKHNNRFSQEYFTHINAKMSFVDLILFLLSLPRATFQFEINKFLINYKPEVESMSKQSVFEARLKLMPKAFIEVDDITRSMAYSEGFNTFKEYRIIAADGSKFGLPANALQYYGGQKTGGEDKAMAMVCSLCDVENEIVLGASIEPYSSNEREMALNLIKNLKKADETNDLFLFDRGFPSTELICELCNNNSSFVFRVNSQFLSVINFANEQDQIVSIETENGLIDLRVVNVTLKNGTVEKLITNIFNNGFSVDDFRQLYNKRWGIESKYHELKSVIQIENFTASNPIIIEQDFFASIAIANLLAIARNQSNEIISDKDQGKTLKYKRKTNNNMAFSELRTIFIFALCELNPIKRALLVNRAIDNISRYSIPIRPNRPSTPRNPKHPSYKFPFNKKSNR